MILKMERAPYGFCWLCSRQLYGLRGVRVDYRGCDVWVHRACADKVQAA